MPMSRQNVKELNDLLAEYDKIVALAKMLEVSEYVRLCIGQEVHIDNPDNVIQDLDKSVVRGWLSDRMSEIETKVRCEPYFTYIERPTIVDRHIPEEVTKKAS